MSDPPTKRASQQKVAAAKKPGDSDLPATAEDRPTVIPPFDLESYAKENAPKATKPPARPTPVSTSAVPSRARRQREEVVIEVDDEPNDTPTVIPARPDLAPPPGADRFRAEAPTFTNELELEHARRLSALSLSSAPPPPADVFEGYGSPSTMPAPEAATAAPPGSMTSPPNSLQGRISALSLADMRMPTPPPPALDDVPDGGGGELGGLVVASPRMPKPLESSEPPPPSQVDPVVDMRDRFSLGDYSGALAVAEMILGKEPSSVEAAKMAEECQRVLIKMYAARIGPLDRVPMVMVQPHELRWLSIDHRAGFLLSLVDGMSSIEMILDVSGMPLLDTLRILHELYQQKVISFRT